MVRTFVAIEITDSDIIRKILDVQKEIAKSARVKLVEPENIHLTLYFLGEVEKQRLELVRDIVKNCVGATPPLKLRLIGIGAFPNTRRPRVIWIGLQGDLDPLEAVFSCLKKKFKRYNFRVEEKSFHPHVTIARVKWSDSRLSKIIDSWKNALFGEIVVRDIKIKKSTLTSKGPIYEDLFVIPLGSTG